MKSRDHHPGRPGQKMVSNGISDNELKVYNCCYVPTGIDCGGY